MISGGFADSRNQPETVHRDSGSGSRGSSPCPAASWKAQQIALVVPRRRERERMRAFQPEKTELARDVIGDLVAEGRGRRDSGAAAPSEEAAERCRAIPASRQDGKQGSQAQPGWSTLTVSSCSRNLVGTHPGPGK